MAALKKLNIAALDLAGRLSLPEDALLGAPRLTVTAGRTVLVENHRGLLEYGTERVRVAAVGGELIINGTELALTAMNASELLLRGKIVSVEWE